jgi:1,4-dihydroxy-2-naphthoyl-CoA hydrolase
LSTAGGHFASDPNALIGLEVGEVREDSVTATVPVSPVVLQPYGIVHGGIYSLVAESICSLATDLAVRDEGLAAMGMANSATFLRPISEGTIHARAERRHRGRTTWVWDVEVTDDAGRLCAMARVTIAVRRPPGGRD